MSTTVGAILEAERESAKAAIGLALRQASLDPSKRGRQEPGRQEPGRQERPDATVPSNPSPPTNVHAVGPGLPPREAYSIGEIRDRARA